MDNENKMKPEQYLNITLKNEADDKENEVIISFSGIFRQLKRFFLVWLVIAIIAGILVPVWYAVFDADQHKNLKAMISFNYSGIESGKAPDGSIFDVNSVKNPAVIEKALTNLGEDVSELEHIRQGLSIEGVTPKDTVDRLTAYKSLYENGNIKAVEEMLDTKIYPTQFTVTFNYSGTSFQGKRAVEVFNEVLTSYSSYFLETYGFNQALGSAVTALDYTEYDYAQAIDVFESTLSTLQDYISNLSDSDSTRFRSTATGYSFSDLSESIATIREVDLDMISSYVTVNTVTKDKNTLLAYYNYRIEELNRQKKISEEELKTITEAIDQYEKDTIIIYGDMQETSQYTQASATYDNLITRKIAAQKSVSTYTQKVDQFQKRIAELNGQATASKSKIEKVEADLEALNEKITGLLDKVNQTANEYYETVYLANSYNVLVPASSSALVTTKNIVKSAMEPLLILEAVLLILYLGIAFIMALIDENRKNKAVMNNTELVEELSSQTQNSSEVSDIDSVMKTEE